MNLKIAIKLIFTGFALASLAACSYVDDFAFGKDNSIKPAKLPVLKHNQSLSIDWSTNTGKFKPLGAIKDLQPYVYHHRIYTASSDGKVQAVDEKSGHILWEKTLAHKLVAGPVVYHNTLAVNTENSSILLLNKENGQRVKTIALSNDALAKPLLLENHLYVKTVNGILYDINMETGRKYWRYDHGSPEIILKASSSPVNYQNMILSGFSDGELLGFDKQNGHVIWQQHIAFPSGASDVESLVDIDTNPIVDGDRIYVATYQGQVGAYAMDSANPIWQRQASTYQDLAISGQMLFMVDSKDIVWAFDKMSGTVLWKQTGLRARGVTAPVIWNHQLWVADRLGVLHGISMQTGQFIGQLNLSGSVISAPVIHDGACLVYTTNGHLHHISMRKK